MFLLIVQILLLNLVETVLDACEALGHGFWLLIPGMPSQDRNIFYRVLGAAFLIVSAILIFKSKAK